MRWLSLARKSAGAGGRRQPPRRPARLPRRLALAVRAGGGAALAALVVGGPVWLVRSGTAAIAIEAAQRLLVAESARLGLTVSEVVLEGRRLAPRRQVAAAVGLKRGDPMLSFDPAAIRERLIAIPWVREAVVERRFPGLVRIRLVERRPLALWQHQGKLVLVDTDGEIITDQYRDVARFRDLLIVVGPDAPRHTPSLIAMIRSEPLLADRVSAAVRVGRRRWNIELADGVKIKLPERDAHEAWRRLARLEAEEKLLERDVRAIDMRLPDRLIVRPGNPGVRPAGARGRNT